MSPTSESQVLLPTHIGRHATIRTLILRARVAGIDVLHEHDRRLIIRTHLLTMTGDADTLRRFQRALSRYWSAQATGTTALELRRQTARQKQRTRDLIAQLTPKEAPGE